MRRRTAALIALLAACGGPTQEAQTTTTVAEIEPNDLNIRFEVETSRETVKMFAIGRRQLTETEISTAIRHFVDDRIGDECQWKRTELAGRALTILDSASEIVGLGTISETAEFVRSTNDNELYACLYTASVSSLPASDFYQLAFGDETVAVAKEQLEAVDWTLVVSIPDR